MNATYTNVRGADELLDARSSTAGRRCRRQRVLAYRVQPAAHRRAGDRRRRAADGRPPTRSGRDVHRRPGHRRPRHARHRGGLRPRRGGRRRPGRARHLRGRQGRAAACSASASAPRPSKSSAARTAATSGVELSGRRRRAGRCSTTTQLLELAELAIADRGALRRAPGHRVGLADGRTLHRPVAPDHHAGDRRTGTRPSGRAVRRPCWSPAWPRRPASVGGRVRILRRTADGRASCRTGEVLVAPDDQPGLGADHAPRRGAGHRRRRHDLPRRDRQPRAGTCRPSSAPAPPPRCCATARSSPSTAPRAWCCAGSVAAAAGRRPASAAPPPRRPPAPARRRRPTGTLLYVNLAIADHAEEVAALPVDGVGLLRAEFMITDALGGEHPKHAAGAAARREEFVERMAASRAADHPRLRAAAGRLPDRTTSAPTSSATSTAARSSSRYEENPMIGYRGCYRYVARARALRARARGARAGARGDAEPAPDDPVRAHRVGARGLPRS